MGSVSDITNLEEEPGQDIISDGCDGCSYLVGLAAGSDTTPPEVFLARIDSRPRFQPYHGRRLPPATQRRPPPPSFGSRGRRLGRRRFAMFTGGLVDADDDAFADFDDY